MGKIIFQSLFYGFCMQMKSNFVTVVIQENFRSSGFLTMYTQRDICGIFWGSPPPPLSQGRRWWTCSSILFIWKSQMFGFFGCYLGTWCPIQMCQFFILWTQHCGTGGRKLKCASLSVCWENKNKTMSHTERFHQPGEKNKKKERNKPKQNNSPTVPRLGFFFGVPRQDPSWCCFPSPSEHINIFHKTSQDCDVGTCSIHRLLLFRRPI